MSVSYKIVPLSLTARSCAARGERRVAAFTVEDDRVAKTVLSAGVGRTDQHALVADGRTGAIRAVTRAERFCRAVLREQGGVLVIIRRTAERRTDDDPGVVDSPRTGRGVAPQIPERRHRPVLVQEPLRVAGDVADHSVAIVQRVWRRARTEIDHGILRWNRRG